MQEQVHFILYYIFGHICDKQELVSFLLYYSQMYLRMLMQTLDLIHYTNHCIMCYIS